MLRPSSTWIIVAVMAAGGVLAGASASAVGPETEGVGIFDPSQGMFYLRDETGGTTSFHYGNPGDVPLMGDWDCDGVDTPGVYRSPGLPNTYHQSATPMLLEFLR